MTVTATRQIPFGRPWIHDEDRAAVLEVLNGHILTHGPQGKAFEEEFAACLGDGAHAVTMSSCMAALHMAFRELDVTAGDEVIVPAQTHTATVHAVELTGATPVFADCDPASGNMTPATIERAVSPRTRAVAVVHYAGIPCDMPAIMRVAGRFGLRVVEDCALALGARYQGVHVGLFGDAGCFSFYPVKHITTGEGGMFVSRDGTLAARVARRRAFGVDRTHADRTVPGMYDVPELGLNYRMSEMQAALGRAQLRRLDENLARRHRTFQRLASALRRIGGVRVIDAADDRASSSYYCLVALLDVPGAEARAGVVARLNAAGVGTSVYYPHPVPRLAYYRRKYGCAPESYPGAVAISDRSVALPVGPHLTDEDVGCLVVTAAAVLGERA